MKKEEKKKEDNLEARSSLRLLFYQNEQEVVDYCIEFAKYHVYHV